MVNRQKKLKELQEENKKLKIGMDLLNSGYFQLKRVTQKLKESEEMFAKAFTYSPYVLTITDPRTGAFIDVNNTFITTTGFTRNEAINNTSLSLRLWENEKDRKSMVERLLDGKVVHNEETLFRVRNGTRLITLFSAQIIHIGGKIYILSSIEDITEQKHAEQRLMRSEKKYRELYESMHDAYVRIDLKGNIVEVNSAYLKMLKFSNDEIRKLSFTDITPKKWHAMENNIIQTQVLVRGFSNIYEKEYVRKDGVVIPVELHTFVLKDENDKPNGMWAIVRDISKRKRIENELKENKARLQGYFELPMTGRAITSPDHKWIEVNKELCHMFGYSKKELTKMTWTEITHPDDLAKDLKQFNRMLQGKIDGYKLEKRFIHKKGRVVYTNLAIQCVRNPDGTVKYVIALLFDTTESKLKEKRDRDIKTQDEAILSSIGDAVFATDKNGKIMLFNKMAETMTGITQKKAIGKHYNKIVHFIRETDGKPGEDFIAKAISKHQISMMEDHTNLVRKDGKHIPVADSAAPIEDVDGSIIGSVVVFHDVTRERQIDKAKTEFVSLASHQLRTPLSAINWYSEMLLSEEVGPFTADQKKYMEEVYHASQRMVKLVNAILNVSRLEVGNFSVEPEETDVIKLAKSCIKDLLPEISKKQLILSQKYDKLVPHMYVDPRLMSIIFQNLLSNSVKYSNRGGRIEFSLKRQRSDLLITISDRGIGIPKEQQKDIFGKLFRANNAKAIDADGSGLGLYIVKQIITNANGKIWFESVEDKGARFYARLPLSGMLPKSGEKHLS